MTPPRIAAAVAAHYRSEYESLFGPLPPADKAGRVLANAGKALAAYVRTLRPEATRFDAYAGALESGRPEAPALFSGQERAGLKVFLGRGQCLRCHHGPLFSNRGFHNTGLPPSAAGAPDLGRIQGVRIALASEFNCRGPYSDARSACPHLEYVRAEAPELVGAFRTPTLRHVAETAPYMHDGRFGTLREVLDHYNRAPGLSREHGHTELFPLGLSPAELDGLEAFLRTLSPRPLARNVKED